jgi:GT2 family glycosyltransferase
VHDPIDLPAADPPRVSVIIPAGAAPGLLSACLGSLARHRPRAIPYETIVVRNGAALAANPLPEPSETGRAAEIEAYLAAMTGVRLVSAGVNLGVAGAGNAGRAVARGEYLVLLHDDAEIQAGWLEALVETADRHPEAGAVGGKVLHPDGSLQNAGMVLWRDATTSPPWAGEPPPLPSEFDRLRAVDYCGTSSLLVRAASWDAAGGLDERFFPAYYVDVDLCMALRRLGQIVLYEPRSRIRHHRGGSADRRFREFVTRRNRERFRVKWREDLEDYEPAAPSSPAAVERALARAEERAAGLLRPGGGGPAAAVAAATPTAVGGAPGKRLKADPAPVAAAVPAPVAEADPAPIGHSFHPAEPSADPVVRDRRHMELDVALQRAYAADLAAALDVALAERVRCEQVLAGERCRAAALEQAAAEFPELRARSVTLAAIERGRWWHLYLRLLPLLRRLRR